MYWFARPPWLRWVLSTALLAAAFGLEVRGPATIEHSFAVSDISAGTELQPGLFRTARVPAGLLPATEPVGYARVDILAGDPLTASVVISEKVSVPDGWWVIELGVPGHVRSGQAVLLVLLVDDPTIVDGVAVAVETTSDAFGGSAAVATIAIPAAAAAEVAVAAAAGNITILTTNY